MKRLLLAATAFLAIALSGTAIRAQRLNFNYTGEVVTFTVPIDGIYQIRAFGAQGGDFNGASLNVPTHLGGRGAEIGGDFGLTAGEILHIAVGGAGTSLRRWRGRGQFRGRIDVAAQTHHSPEPRASTSSARPQATGT